MSSVRGLNVLLVVSDTFRRDNLSAYGGPPALTPNLNRFLEGASVFDRFYACSFPTVPARADLMTGRAAFTRQGWGPLNAEWETVAQRASAAGYRTMTVTDVPFLMRSGYGYDRGFEDYLWVRGQPDRLHPESHHDVRSTWRQETDHFAPRTMTAAADWLERRTAEDSSRPFFLVVDTWDPHEPFDAPRHYVRRFRAEYGGEEIPYPPYDRVGASEEERESLALAYAGYLGKTQMVDFWIGYLLDRLEAVGLADDTVVLFLSDHGFYFGEHGFFGKSIGWRIGPVSEEVSAVGEMGRSPLYEELCHVPLAVRVPGWKPARVHGVASMPDVAATVLDIVGAEPAEESHSLIADSGDCLTGPRALAVTSWPMHLPGEATRAVDSASRRFSGFMPITVSSARWSLLYSDNEGEVELYDLEEDPAQTTNVAGDRMDVVEELHAGLVALLEEVGCPPIYLEPRTRVARRTAVPAAD